MSCNFIDLYGYTQFHSNRIGPRGKCVQAFSIISPLQKKKTVPARYYVAKDRMERERGEIVDGGWLPEERSRRSYLSVIRAIGFLLSLPSLPHPFLSLSCFEFPLVAILFEISRTQPPSNRTNETGGKKKGAGEIVSNKESRILRINRSNFGHSDRSSLQKNLAWSQSSSIPNIYWLIFLNLHVCLILFLNWKEFESTKIWFSGFRKIHRQLYHMLVRNVTFTNQLRKKLGISKHDSLKSWKRWSEDRRSN